MHITIRFQAPARCSSIHSKHLFDAPPLLAPKLGIPAPVEAVIMRALAKDLEERQPDTAAFGRELQEAERHKQALEAEFRRAEEESRLLASKQQREREE